MFFIVFAFPEAESPERMNAFGAALPTVGDVAGCDFVLLRF